MTSTTSGGVPVEDVRPLIKCRPCADLATTLFPEADGELPAGSLPAV